MLRGVAEPSDDDAVWSHGWSLQLTVNRCRSLRRGRAHDRAGDSGVGRRGDSTLGVELAVRDGASALHRAGDAGVRLVSAPVGVHCAVGGVGETGDDDAVRPHGWPLPLTRRRVDGHGAAHHGAGNAVVGRPVDSPIGVELAVRDRVLGCRVVRQRSAHDRAGDPDVRRPIVGGRVSAMANAGDERVTLPDHLGDRREGRDPSARRGVPAIQHHGRRRHVGIGDAPPPPFSMVEPRGWTAWRGDRRRR